MRCEDCGRLDGQIMADPFMEDVYNEIVMVVLCGDCEYERALEI